MIRMVQSTSAGHAKAYFSDALLKSDYYLDEQELQGRYNGQLAKRLGLREYATKETFDKLSDNISPLTGNTLTPRSKENRTVGYDINFHCPKSVSILHALAKDDHILEAFEKSVSDTMKDIEADTTTRVRKAGSYEDRKTGELVWAEFTHQTARPVEDQTPDPHLHSHCFVFNATWDETERRFKAAKFRDIKGDMPYYQAMFHKRLSDKMLALGYQVRPTDKSFEIIGVPQKVIDLFSKRTDEIGRTAKEKGITDAKELDSLGARTRSKKQKGTSMSELKKGWRDQLKEISQDDKSGEQEGAVRYAPVKEKEPVAVTDCVDYALKHSFERASVMRERSILSTAYKHALGEHDISLDDITDNFRQDTRIIEVQEDGRKLCTMKGILLEEKRMVELARQGQGKLTPLYHKVPELKLNDEQAAAVNHVLTTRDRVSIIRGAAGTGKTTLMRDAVKLMEQAGRKVIVVAPTSQAARGVLKEEGFEKAETVARLLVDEKLQNELQDQVLWVDEAGLLGTKDMTGLLTLATEKNARLILGGDTRQHTAVVRGDALRILNTIGGIRAAEVTKIYRQRDQIYRTAVDDLSKGDISQAFEKLDAMGSIKAIDPMKPHEELVTDYIKTIEKGKTALVVSPTHKQGDEVTAAIRSKLREAGMIGKKEVMAKKLSNLNLTEAQKQDFRNFTAGDVIQFNQNAPDFKRGSTCSVKEIKDRQVWIEDEKGKVLMLPSQKTKDFDVFKKTEIGLSKGDKVMITRNGFTDDEKRLNNGMTLEVASINKKGKIVLRNSSSKLSYVVDKNYGHLNHAHCVTSHASQGKTVDEVFIAQPSSTFAATDAKQFYVSVSRGRDAARVYTDDREALLEQALQLGDRKSAIELVNGKPSHMDHVRHLQRSTYENLEKFREVKANVTRHRNDKDREYEPRF